MDRRHAPGTHGQRAGAQSARRVPTVPADILVYTTLTKSVITRRWRNFELVRFMGRRSGYFGFGSAAISSAGSSWSITRAASTRRVCSHSS